jgi:putative ABC transport system ATP-binding protein
MLAEKYGKTIIAVTHSNAVSKLSDKRVLLKDGTLHTIV